MATQTIEFIAPSGLTLTCRLFPVGSDTQESTDKSATEETNRKGVYTAAWTDAPAGEYLMIAFSGSDAVATARRRLTAATATFRESLENVDKFDSASITASGGRPEVNTTHWGGTAVASATVNANMTQISGDAVAADNLEAALDGTGGVTITAALTGNVTGNLSGSVGSLGTQAKADVNAEVDTALAEYDAVVPADLPANFASLGINVSGHVARVTLVDTTTTNTDMRGTDGAAQPGDQMDLVNAPNATAITAIQNGLSTLTQAGVRSAVGLASANLDTQLGAIVEDTGTTIPSQIGGLNNLSQSQAQSAAAAALTAYDPPTRTEATADKAEILTRLGTPAGASVSADIAAIPTTIRVKKNAALAGFSFPMVDASDDLLTGLTVTATRSIDGGALGACANAVSEIGSGLYKIDLDAADLNGDTVTLKFTADGAKDTLITLVTQP